MRVRRLVTFLIIVVAVAAGLCIFIYDYNYQVKSAPTVQQTEAPSSSQAGESIVLPSSTSISPIAQTTITLKAGTTTYTVPFSGHESVYSLMQALATTTDFSFTAKYYPSLGWFIESINNIQNAGGKYWMLYINGVQSQLGASSAVVGVNDLIEWRYEQ